jgi:hypothetical protein
MAPTTSFVENGAVLADAAVDCFADRGELGLAADGMVWIDESKR